MIERRLESLRTQLAANEVDAFVSLKLVNTYYLSGFTSLDTARPTSYVRPIAVVVDAAGACLIAPLLDEEAAGHSSHIRDIRCYSASPAAAAARDLVAERLRELGARRIAVEEDAITAEWLDYLRDTVPGCEVVYGRKWVEALRLRKDETEIDTIRRAARLADAAIEASLGASVSGTSEMSAETQGVIGLRAAATSLDEDTAIVDAIPMVLCGPRSSMPHEFTTNRPMEQGELMWHCWLVSYRGYWVENIRTGIVEADASAFADSYGLLRESLLAGQEAARPGATAHDVYHAVMNVLRSRPVEGGVILNRSGHGMGLEYHEPPFIEDGDETLLEPGVVITVEPGIWMPGTGGLALSNTLVVREREPEVLTETAIDLHEAWGKLQGPLSASVTSS
jgi:Xaa-Pro aminopeptidase